jgi:hypothetical protein
MGLYGSLTGDNFRDCGFGFICVGLGEGGVCYAKGKGEG